MQIKDIKFSNSITVEHNTLGGGAIGHIVRNRRVEADTAVLTDTWFHYDQVGSVLSESDAGGDLVATHYQDAFGVRQADWETGLPGGVGEGWAHNTKELDAGTGLMYMYQRHYIPEYGQFMSRAPYGPMLEHEFTFVGGDPVSFIDSNGRSRKHFTVLDLYCADRVAKRAHNMAESSGLPGPVQGPRDAYRHCVWMCMTVQDCGWEAAYIAGGGHEVYSPGRIPFLFEPWGTAMDLYNNSMGRMAGLIVTDCDKSCRDMLECDELWVLDD
jgi:RHS repeat-associated protein